MGVERIIHPEGNASADWAAIKAALETLGETPVLRMIDGLPAFPGEIPEAGWQELRVGLSGGMVTLRKVETDYRCITWGNADPALQRSWNLLAYTVAQTTGGTVTSESGELTSEAFGKQQGLI